MLYENQICQLIVDIKRKTQDKKQHQNNKTPTPRKIQKQEKHNQTKRQH